ncbi:Cna B-type domain-containing protein, partial [Methanosphaera sp.]|uniref:Cna B-type domain-containing protein n=1 Tax=Methanosphaera sp. TaxID=2666342 RepID=UPI002E78178F
EFNTAYRLVETTAPKGYILNDTPYEFYISNVDEGQYPKKIPEDFSGETYTSGKVIYFKNEKNTEYDVMALSIEKEWYNIYGDAISRTRSLIAVNLYQLSYLDEEKATDPVTDNLYKAGIIIDSQSGWKVTLDDLPVSGIENIDGEDTTVYYSYYIREPGIRGYSAEYENNNISVTDGTITLKNTGDEEVQETEITIEKKWLDKNNEAIQKDSGDVRVNLYQKVYEDHLCEYQITTREYQSDIVISAENDWKTTIRNLPEYGTEKVDGQYMIVYYTYYVEEVPVDGYTAVYENNDGIYEGTITINNKEDENMTELVVEKQWYDKDNNLIEKSDGSITITLYQKVHTDASYENYISEHMYQSDVVMNAETNWKLTISDLPKSGTESIDGKEMTVYYTYYVKEQSVEGYNTTYENNKGISEGTIIIQNKEIENYSLPETGGIGTTIYVITGIFLVMGSLLYGYNLKHRRKEVKK